MVDSRSLHDDPLDLDTYDPKPLHFEAAMGDQSQVSGGSPSRSALARAGSISKLQGPRNISGLNSPLRARKVVTFGQMDEVIQYDVPTPETNSEIFDVLQPVGSPPLGHRPLPNLPQDGDWHDHAGAFALPSKLHMGLVEDDLDLDTRMDAVMEGKPGAKPFVRSHRKELSWDSIALHESLQAVPDPYGNDFGDAEVDSDEDSHHFDRLPSVIRKESLLDEQRRPTTLRMSSKDLPAPQNDEIQRTYSQRRKALLKMLDANKASVPASIEEEPEVPDTPTYDLFGNSGVLGMNLSPERESAMELLSPQRSPEHSSARQSGLEGADSPDRTQPLRLASRKSDGHEQPTELDELARLKAAEREQEDWARKLDFQRVELERAENRLREVPERESAERTATREAEHELAKLAEIEARQQTELENKRREVEEAERIEQERIEQERVDTERAETERLEKERAEADRAEKEASELKFREKQELARLDQERKQQEARALELERLRELQRRAEKEAEQARELERIRSEEQRRIELANDPAMKKVPTPNLDGVALSPFAFNIPGTPDPSFGVGPVGQSVDAKEPEDYSSIDMPRLDSDLSDSDDSEANADLYIVETQNANAEFARSLSIETGASLESFASGLSDFGSPSHGYTLREESNYVVASSPNRRVLPQRPAQGPIEIGGSRTMPSAASCSRLNQASPQRMVHSASASPVKVPVHGLNKPPVMNPESTAGFVFPGPGMNTVTEKSALEPPVRKPVPQSASGSSPPTGKAGAHIPPLTVPPASSKTPSIEALRGPQLFAKENRAETMSPAPTRQEAELQKPLESPKKPSIEALRGPQLKKKVSSLSKASSPGQLLSPNASTQRFSMVSTNSPEMAKIATMERAEAVNVSRSSLEQEQVPGVTRYVHSEPIVEDELGESPKQTPKKRHSKTVSWTFPDSEPELNPGRVRESVRGLRKHNAPSSSMLPMAMGSSSRNLIYHNAKPSVASVVSARNKQLGRTAVANERGRLYLRIDEIHSIQLPAISSHKAQLRFDLDNGEHCVRTSALPMEKSSVEVKQEYEFAVRDGQSLVITALTKVGPPSGRSKLFKRLSAGSKDSWPNSVGQGGAFGRCTFDFASMEQEAYGQAKTVQIPLRGEWRENSKDETIAMLKVTMLFAPRLTPREQLPPTLVDARDMIVAAREHNTEVMSGVLRQRGGDCGKPKYRYFVLDNSALISFSEKTRQPRGAIGLAKAVGVREISTGFAIDFSRGETIEFDTEDLSWIENVDKVVKTPKSRSPWLTLTLYSRASATHSPRL